MTNRRDVRTCSLCGSILDAGERCECERIQAKAERLGYSIRPKRRTSGVFEILNAHGHVIGEGNDFDRLGDFLDILAKTSTRPFYGGIS